MDIAENTDLRMGKANQQVFSDTLQELAATDRNIIAVTSDSRGSGKMVSYGQKFPGQIVEVGIAEQNLVGVAAGLASAGKKAIAVSPACFLTARALEQIKNDVAYSDNPVTLVGISAGVSYGALGTTHHSLHDFAALRAINNMIIVAPADNFETEQALRHAAVLDKPVYIRLGKKKMPFLNESNQSFEFGQGRIIREGADLSILASGETVYPAWQAAKALETVHGIKATVVSMHTIKPLDTNLLDKLAARGLPLISIEEHMVNGGLGEAIASYLFQKGARNPMSIMGIPDEYTVSGSQEEIFNHYGISRDGIMARAKALLK